MNTLADVIQGCFAALILGGFVAVSVLVGIVFPKIGGLLFWNKFLGFPIWKFLFEKPIKRWWRSKRGARRALGKRAGGAAKRGLRRVFDGIWNFLRSLW